MTQQPQKIPKVMIYLKWLGIILLILSTLFGIAGYIVKLDIIPTIITFVLACLAVPLSILQINKKAFSSVLQNKKIGLQALGVALFLSSLTMNFYLLFGSHTFPFPTRQPPVIQLTSPSITPTIPNPTATSSPTVVSSSLTQTATPAPPTPAPPTPAPPTPAPPAQTLATFCTDMKAGNNTDAKTQFTLQGWLQFQPPTDPNPRKRYSLCTPDPIPTTPDKTIPGHLFVITADNHLTYRINLTLILDGNSWKINSWYSHKL